MKNDDFGNAPIEMCQNGVRRVLFHGRSGFTTENTENHGVPRRFFAMTRRKPIAAAEPFTRALKRPVSPWFSVVLRVLRGKTLRPKIEPTWSKESTDICPALLPPEPITFKGHSI